MPTETLLMRMLMPMLGLTGGEPERCPLHMAHAAATAAWTAVHRDRCSHMIYLTQSWAVLTGQLKLKGRMNDFRFSLFPSLKCSAHL